MATMNSVGTKITVTSDGNVTNSTQPAFSVYLNTAAYDQTGDGTVYTVPCDTEEYDKGSNFNIYTHEFTAPVTGKYFLKFSQYIYQFDVPATNIEATLSASNRDFSNGNTGATVSGTGGFNGYAFAACFALIDMDAGDTCVPKIMMAGTTRSGDLTSDKFQGLLVC